MTTITTRSGLRGLGLTIPLALGVITAGAGAQSTPLPGGPAVRQAVDSVVRGRLQHPLGPASVSLMMLRGADTLVHAAWGTADAATGRLAAPNMSYRIASISKQFTAALILKLVDRGKLSLRDSLGRHLSGVRPEWRAITVEQLLNHTSGLQNDYRHNRPAGSAMKSQPARTLIAWAAQDTMLAAPGTRYAYSNTGYMLLGALVEKVYGKPYRDALRNEIARPLALTTLGWCTSAEMRRAQVTGHSRSPTGTLHPADDMLTDLALGAGGLCASASDLARWAIALHGGRVLSPASYTAMTTPRGHAVKEGYGFGIHVQPTPWGTPMFGHGGGTNGFLSESWFLPTESLSVTVLQNSEPSPPGTSSMSPALMRIALGRVMATTAGEATGPGALAGFYEGPRLGTGLEVTVEGDLLYGNMNAGGKLRLVPKEGTTYWVGRENSPMGTITFTMNPDGRPTAALMRLANGRELSMPKVR